MNNTAHHPKILIVDDKPENLIVLEKLLKPLEVALYKANSGNEALALTLDHDFMLILLDVQMPGMDGYEVLDLLSMDEHTKYIPVIFITANYADETHELKGYEYGAVDYLQKPINKQILLGKVSVFLELFKQRNKYQALNQRFHSILNSAGEGIFGLDWEGKITFINPAAENLLAYQPKALINKDFALLHPKLDEAGNHLDYSWQDSDIHLNCRSGKIISCDNDNFMKSDGTVFPVEYKATPLTSINSDDEGIVIVFSDITLRKSIEKQLTQLALYDHLTELPNRLLFEKTLRQAFAKAKRNQQLLAVMFLDLDHFKQINDTLGHDCGDLLLKGVAVRIKGILRESDTFARLGGDEFAIILDDIKTPDDCRQVADKIIHALQEPFHLSNHDITAGTSIGIAIYPSAADDTHSLVKNADIAMYQAKSAQCNSYQFYRPTTNKQSMEQVKIEKALIEALDNQQFYLSYQPKINPKNNTVYGLAALIYWQHDDLGIIQPNKFIPIAEELGILPKIADWTINQACEDLVSWKKYGFNDLKLAINLSNLQITHDSISQRLKHYLNVYQIEAQQIEIELTETTLMTHRQCCIDILQSLHGINLIITIDDFGSGYSSLNYLTSLPIDTLKINQVFIQQLENNQNNQAIIKAIISLAHTLNLNVVAEGVETAAQFEFLLQNSCDYIQGLYFCAPKSKDEILTYLKAQQIKDQSR